MTIHTEELDEALSQMAPEGSVVSFDTRWWDGICLTSVADTCIERD
jgi:hypothetical protein